MRNRHILYCIIASAALTLPAASAHASSEPTTANLAVVKTEGYAVYGDTSTITTSLQITTMMPLAGSLRLGGRDLELAADTSAMLRFGAQLGGPSVGAVKVSGTNVDASTFVTFKSPTGQRVTGYEIPLLTTKVADEPGTTEVRLLTSPQDGSFGTALLLFNVSSERAWVTATIYDDAHPAKPTREYILTDPRGALTWYDVQTKFETGRIELTRGITSGFGCPGCDARGEVYGFAAIGTPGGDAPRVRPLTPKQQASLILP